MLLSFARRATELARLIPLLTTLARSMLLADGLVTPSRKAPHPRELAATTRFTVSLENT